MNHEAFDVALQNMVEQLAAIEHERWSHWQRFVHSKGQRLPDGALVIPAELVARWERQMAASFAELPEAERQSDREQVQRYLPLIKAGLIQAFS